MKHLCSAAFLVTMLTWPSLVPLAWADEPPRDVETLIERGVAYRKEGRDDLALAQFRQAWDLMRSPKALAQMGLAEQALGLWLESEQHLREALSNQTEAWINQHRPVLEQSLREVSARLGMLDVMSNVEGAELYVNGERVGRLPRKDPIRLVAGDYTLELRAEGYFPATRRATVPAQGTARETLRLSPRTESPEAKKPPAPIPVRVLPPVPEGPRLERTLAWISLGGSAVFLGTGTALLLMRQGVVDEYDDDPDCPGANAPSQGSAQCSDRLSKAKTMRTLGIAGLGVGAALGVTSAVLMVISGSPSTERQSAWCGAGPGTFGVSCLQRF
jgi:hypothetical protein